MDFQDCEMIVEELTSNFQQNFESVKGDLIKFAQENIQNIRDQNGSFIPSSFDQQMNNENESSCFPCDAIFMFENDQDSSFNLTDESVSLQLNSTNFSQQCYSPSEKEIKEYSYTPQSQLQTQPQPHATTKTHLQFQLQPPRESIPGTLTKFFTKSSFVIKHIFYALYHY